MNDKNKLAIIILTVIVFSLFKITIVKANGCDVDTSNTCDPDTTCKIECGERFIRNLSVGQKHYYNFTTTMWMRVSVRVKPETLGNKFNLFVQWSGGCPTHPQLDGNPEIEPQCSDFGPSTNKMCTNITLPPGTYYFAVYHEFVDDNVPYNLSLSCTAISEPGTFCCGPPGHKLCYNSGVCCLMGTLSEYWHLKSCFDFDTWVKPERMMFTLGAKIPVNLYIKNKGGYTDAYTIDYFITSSNPELIKVDLTGVTPTGSVAHGEIKKLYPRIMTLYTDATGDVTFNVSSQGDPTLYKTATLNIIESDFPLSLPEFDIFGLIGMIIIAGIVYLITQKNDEFKSLIF